MAKNHPFSHTMIEHHLDGTSTVHHIHGQNGYAPQIPFREGDVRGAVGDHDGMMDHLIDHTSGPNEGEDSDENMEKFEEAIHPGIHKEAEEAAKKKDVD